MDKSKLMMTIIIALLVLLLGTVVGVTLYLINFVGTGDGDAAIGYRPPTNVLTIMDLEPIVLGDGIIVTNLATGADGRARMIRANVVANIDTTRDAAEYEEFVREFTHRISSARGLAVTIFNGLTYDQVRTPEGQAMVAEMIRNTLQEAFNTNLIVSIVFDEWVLT